MNAHVPTGNPARPTTAIDQPDFVTLRPATGDEHLLRLYCMPPAGMNAAYFQAFTPYLPTTISVHALQLPGRGRATGTPVHTDPHRLGQLLAERIRQDDDGHPYAVFGHSVGALIAHETVTSLTRQGHRPPTLLALSAMAAPHHPDFTARAPDVLLGGREGIEKLFGRLPDHAAHDPRALINTWIPKLADLLLALQSPPHQGPPLDTQLALYGGEDDPVISPDALAGWNDITSRPATPRLFPGNHTYPLDNVQALSSRLTADIVTSLRGWYVQPTAPAHTRGSVHEPVIQGPVSNVTRTR
ncbi:thioesterase II family protein [Streptantibioticus cattleyicolor]|uniref:Thioesterase n=1 Tax=Streptantibioticus cattleyicolor (strain ATCC 35852 / DSM 46488 / JCM 4925 / NBRC 14057 / NRRL 8057) TaxID=1003195 RepID=F8JLV1_STREN|nr:alpha/beta fold hydrolase [Streptantibioticus cattleyicolor]AEW98241.1 Thioesterase [Streptantibioticus cattleyicolor NRRL 8057 = DSM 46488]CCB72695.1 putative Oleoyl-[acyl-carrier-protein] hydrolase [Streptantibioticus cattleyicolor NRRL 8057 = DSM 46488]